nr:MAG TPA: hypothetical protein [Caudoviricetes sp.]
MCASNFLSFTQNLSFPMRSLKRSRCSFFNLLNFF